MLFRDLPYFFKARHAALPLDQGKADFEAASKDEFLATFRKQSHKDACSLIKQMKTAFRTTINVAKSTMGHRSEKAQGLVG